MQPKLTTQGLTGAIFLLCSACLLAQTSGVSHPEAIEGTVTTSPATTGKPSPAVPLEAESAVAQPDASATEHYVARAGGAQMGKGPVLHTHAASSGRPAAEDVSNPSPALDHSLEVTEDVNSGIVTEVPSRPGELHSGSLLRARLETRLSTADSPVGTHFTARLERPVERRGEVLLPAGTVLSGRVADVHGGSRLRGGALLRLQPDSVSLPDGTVHALSADLIDLGDGAERNNDQRVDSEGVVHQRSHPKRDLSAAGLATGSGAVAGAMIGGGIGAVVGAGIGAGVSTVVWLRHDQQEVLPVGTVLVFSLNESLALRASAF